MPPSSFSTGREEKVGLSEAARRSLSSDKHRGPKDQKNSRFRARLKILSENEIFDERAPHRGAIFVGKLRRRD